MKSLYSFKNIEKRVKNKNTIRKFENITDLATPYYQATFVPRPHEIFYISNHFLKYVKYETPINKNYTPWEKTEHKRKRLFIIL